MMWLEEIILMCKIIDSIKCRDLIYINTARQKPHRYIRSATKLIKVTSKCESKADNVNDRCVSSCSAVVIRALETI